MKKYLIYINAVASPRNPGAWWDLKEFILKIDDEKDLKKALTKYLKEELNILNKNLKYIPMYMDDENGNPVICGVITNVYTEFFEDGEWKKVYFEFWIRIQKIEEATEDIVSSFKFKD